MFEKADVDNSGALGMEEMGACLSRLELTASESELQELAENFDFDGDGTLDLDVIHDTTCLCCQTTHYDHDGWWAGESVSEWRVDTC